LKEITMTDRNMDQHPLRSAEIDWRMFKGERIRVYLMLDEWLSHTFDSFTELTGIGVDVEEYPHYELFARLETALSSGSSVIDVVPLGSTQLGTFVPAGWIEPLDSYFDNPLLTDIDWYDLEDLQNSARDHASYRGGLYAIPIDSSASCLMYRRDVTVEKGMGVPKTFEELHEAAISLQNPPNFYGVSCRGFRGFDVVWGWLPWFLSYGGQILSREGQPHFDSPEGVEATRLWADTLRRAGPPDVSNYEFYDARDTFLGGRAAFFLDVTSCAGQVESPDYSVVHSGRVGWAPVPAARVQAQGKSPYWFWMVAISAFSQRKEPAFLFCQWLTSKPIAKQLALTSLRSGRVSAWDNDEFKAKISPDWVEVTNQTLASLDLKSIPYEHPQIEQIWDQLGLALNQVVAGQKDADTALKGAKEQLDAVLE
jgi:multiple sugar transport system substrate-binding protein